MIGGEILKVSFTYHLYFFNSKTGLFSCIFYLRTPSFANWPVCVYIANLYGEVGQNILGGQKNVNMLKIQFKCCTSSRNTTIAITK